MPPPPPAHESLPLFEKSYLSPDADPQLDFNLTPPSPVHESTPLFESDNTSPEVEQDVDEPGTNFWDNIPENSVSDLPIVTNLSQTESDSGKI